MAVIVNPDDSDWTAPTNPDDDGTSDTTGDEVVESPYQDVLHAPILYENAVDDDTTQGVACLWDYTSSVTTWNANQAAANQTNYPLNGEFAKLIKRGMVLLVDKDQDHTHQKFRITDTTYSDTGLVINSTEIGADYLSNNPLEINKISEPNMSAGEMIERILSSTAKQIPELNYDSDVVTPKQVDVDVSSVNALNALLDPDQQGDKPTASVLANFGGDFIFDNFTIYHRKNGGRDTGITLKYGHNIKSYSQERSINNTNVGIYLYATYQPQQPVADMKNTDWSSFDSDWTSIGSVSYWGGNGVTIYDAPVAGHNAIGTLGIGQQIKLGKPITNGQLIPNPKIKGGTLQVNTVNGHTWYPIYTEDGGGWIDGSFVNFSKDGDYIVNDAVGHVTVDVKGTDTKLTRYPVSGTATVAYDGIHVYYSPDPGKDHYRRTGKGMKKRKGSQIHYDWIDVDENGTKWYRIGSHQWLYGPHLKVDDEQSVASYPSRGTGMVKKGAPVYSVNTKTGKVTQKFHHLSVAAARKKHQRPYKYVYRGKGKKRRKHKVKNPDYRKGKAIKQKHKVQKLNYGQVVVAGTTYYKLSNGTYVKSSSIDWKNRRSRKPTAPDDIIAANADKYGEVDLYNAPSKASGSKKDGHAENIVIKDGATFRVDHTAQGADGQTWYEVTVTHKGKDVTGWIPSEVTSTTAVGDIEPHAPDEDDSGDETGASSDSAIPSADQQTEVLVQLDDSMPNVYNHVYYPDGMYEVENAHIMKLDVSSEFSHDDQDLSGQQDDGTFVATDADKQELYGIAPDACKEYSIGYFPVTSTLTPKDFTGIDADIASLHLYDTLNFDFVKYGDKIEQGKVTSTVWEMKGEDSTFQQVVVGDPPQTYLHLLSEKIKKQGEALKATTNAKIAHTGHLLGDIQNALKMEGQDRVSAEKDIMKDVGLLQTVTDKHGREIEHFDVSLKDFDKQIQNINADQQEIRNEIFNGGTEELQFLDSSGNTNFLHPTQIRAYNPDKNTALVFNSNGIGWFDLSNGSVRSAMDDQGYVAADHIAAGTLDAMVLEACEIRGALTVGNKETGISISIGTNQPSGDSLRPVYGGNGIWLDSSNYHSLVSSGRFVTTDGTDKWEYGTNGPVHNGNSMKSIVKGWVDSWIHKTVTVRGKKYPIYR